MSLIIKKHPIDSKRNTTIVFAVLVLLIIASCSLQSETPTVSTNTPAVISVLTRTKNPTNVVVTLAPTSTTTQPALTPQSSPISMPLMGVKTQNMLAVSHPYLLTQTKSQIVRRNGILWTKVEPNEGDRNWYVLNNLEQDLINISNNGMETILVVRGTPACVQKV